MGHVLRLAVILLAGLGRAAALDPAPGATPAPVKAEPAAPADATAPGKPEARPAGRQGRASASGFRAGQVWSFKARSGERGATLTVLLVERLPGIGEVVHFRLDGLHVRSPENPGGFADSIDHLPINGEALARSVTTLVRDEEPLPDFMDDVRAWRRLVATRRAGVYNMTVAEIVEFIEQKLNR